MEEMAAEAGTDPATAVEWLLKTLNSLPPQPSSMPNSAFRFAEAILACATVSRFLQLLGRQTPAYVIFENLVATLEGLEKTLNGLESASPALDRKGAAAIATLLERLSLMAVTIRPHGDTVSTAYKRDLAVITLASCAEFLRTARVSERVPDALVEVSLGLDDLNSGRQAPVLEGHVTGKAKPTHVWLCRADIAALIDAMSNISLQEPQPMPQLKAAETILSQLSGNVMRIAGSNTKPVTPKTLINILADFRTRKSSNEIAQTRFEAKKWRYRRMLLTDTRAQWDKRVKQIVEEIESEIEKVPSEK